MFDGFLKYLVNVLVLILFKLPFPKFDALSTNLKFNKGAFSLYKFLIIRLGILICQNHTSEAISMVTTSQTAPRCRTSGGGGAAPRRR